MTIKNIIIIKKNYYKKETFLVLHRIKKPIPFKYHLKNYVKEIVPSYNE